MKSKAAYFILLLLCLFYSVEASASYLEQKIQRIYLDNPNENNNELHIVYADGRDVLAPKLNSKQLESLSDYKEKDLSQAGFIFPRISPDGKTVALEANIMHPQIDSEPWPSALVVYRDGKIISVIKPSEPAIGGWAFLKDGKQIAMSSSTLHFVTGKAYDLYETDTGKKLKEFGWIAEENPPLPDWALAAKEGE